MATHTGDEGSISWGGVAVAEVLDWSMSGGTVGVIEDSVKGDVVRTYKPGRKDPGTITMRGQLDLAGTAAKAWWDEITDGVAAVAATVVATVSTGKTFTFSTIPTTGTTNSPEGEAIAAIELSAKISGTIITAWA